MAESNDPGKMADKLREVQDFDFRESDWEELAGRLSHERAQQRPFYSWWLLGLGLLLILLLGLLFWQNFLLRNNDQELQHLHQQINGLQAQLLQSSSSLPCDTIYLTAKHQNAPIANNLQSTKGLYDFSTIAKEATSSTATAPNLGKVNSQNPSETPGSYRFGALLLSAPPNTPSPRIYPLPPYLNPKVTPSIKVVANEAADSLILPLPKARLSNKLAGSPAKTSPWQLGLNFGRKGLICADCPPPKANWDLGLQVRYRVAKFLGLGLRYDFHRLQETYSNAEDIPFLLERPLETEEYRFDSLRLQTRYSQLAFGLHFKLPLQIEVGGNLLLQYGLARIGELQANLIFAERKITFDEQHLQSAYRINHWELTLSKHFNLTKRLSLPLEVFYQNHLEKNADSLPRMWGLRSGLLLRLK